MILLGVLNVKFQFMILLNLLFTEDSTGLRLNKVVLRVGNNGLLRLPVRPAVKLLYLVT